MPAFVRKILLFITGYAWLVLVAGLGLFGMALHSLWKAEGDHAWTAREQLSRIEGTVTEAARVSVETKRRGRTTRTRESHYELSVQGADGSTHKLRVDLQVSEAAVAYVVDEPIAALADAENDYLVYELRVQGAEEEGEEGQEQVLFEYEDIRAMLQERARRAAANMNNVGTWGAALGLVLIGSGGVWGRRKLLAAARADAAAQQADG